MSASDDPPASSNEGARAHAHGNLEATLVALAEAGARAFDPPGWILVDALLRRADSAPAGAAARLRARATERLARLERSFSAAVDARVGVSAALDASSRANEVPSHARALRASLARNEASASSAEARHAVAARYERAWGDVAAAVEVARAVDSLPEAAGPYNALTLAARTLSELGALSPSYLRVQVLRLVHLGSLAMRSEVRRERAPARRQRK